jgi:cytochrome c biogenesis protein
LLSRFLSVLCSVRFGVVLLILLGLACLIGMLIMQQNVDGFERYYAELTPAERYVYGGLGFFDIYHVWYFNALLAVLSLNIILASFDRFPKTYIYLAKPTLTVPLRWLREQVGAQTIELAGKHKKEVVAEIQSSLRQAGFRKSQITERNGRTFVFAQSGTWNRLGAYAVHVALLLIFLGGFMTAQLGQNGQMPLAPGQTSNEIFDTVVELDKVNQITKRLPFEIICTDIQQKLIRNDGSLGVGNTIDWLTWIRIKDGDQTVEGLVQMNRPFDYRGYRFFQGSYVPTGRARQISLQVNSEQNGATTAVTIPRDGTTTLPDGTAVRFVDFRGNFSLGQENPNEDTSSYPNPGAILEVTTPGGKPQTAYAFGKDVGNIPVGTKAVGGYTFKLADFEKVGEQHILAVQRDPGATVVYWGFALLSLTLVGVFFFSHQRVWATVEETSDQELTVTVAGNSNRNQNALEERIGRIVKELRPQV